MLPDVTVVIAAWKAEATIVAAVESALAQTGVTVEVLVVDDASPDQTATLVAAINDPRIRMLRLTENAGPGGARNAGFADAQGEWIAVLDSDDTMEPDRLQRMIARGRAAKADIVIDNLAVKREGSSATPMFPRALLAACDPLDLAGFIRSNTLFRSKFNLGYTKPVFARSFIEKHSVRYDEGLRIGEDYLFLADCLAYGARCVADVEGGYVYHIRSDSISRVLSATEVDRIAAADRRFLARHRLTGAAALAQHRRTRSFVEVASFLRLVDAIKARDLGRAVSIIGAQPLASRYLWMPVAARCRRLFGYAN